MSLQGRCEKCGGETTDYRCLNCIEEELASTKLQIEEIKKEFAIHSCPRSGGFCWLCAASERVEKVLSKDLKR